MVVVVAGVEAACTRVSCGRGSGAGRRSADAAPARAASTRASGRTARGGSAAVVRQVRVRLARPDATRPRYRQPATTHTSIEIKLGTKVLRHVHYYKVNARECETGSSSRAENNRFIPARPGPGVGR